MKKIAFAFLAVWISTTATAETFSNLLAQAVATGNRTNVTDLLGTENCRTTAVYQAAMNLTPHGEKLAYISNTPSGWWARDRLVLIASYDEHGKGTDFNYMLNSYYSAAVRNDVYGIRNFDPSVCSTGDCIAFYTMVLKNVPLNEQNLTTLSWVKGELLKLKGLE